MSPRLFARFIKKIFIFLFKINIFFFLLYLEISRREVELSFIWNIYSFLLSLQKGFLKGVFICLLSLFLFFFYYISYSQLESLGFVPPSMFQFYVEIQRNIRSVDFCAVFIGTLIKKKLYVIILFTIIYACFYRNWFICSLYRIVLFIYTVYI